MTSLGLDIGGTRVKAAVLHENGSAELLGKSQPYRRPDTQALTTAVGEVVNGHRFDAVGLCCPGLLSFDRTTIEKSVNLPGLEGVPLTELIERATGRPAGRLRIATDQVAAATDFAFSHQLHGRLMAVSIGTGVGAAVLDIDNDHPLGQPLRVDGDSPGHFGQLDVTMSRNPPIGPDGGAGSLEAYIGALALHGRKPQTLHAGHRSIRALVRALRIAHALYRPHTIALLGGIGSRLTHLRREILAGVNDHLTNIARPDWALVFGDDDHHAARGVARLAAASDP
ncbi:MAG: ROK family protein [Planctomycetota bacterium]